METRAKLTHVVLLRAFTIILVVLVYSTRGSNAPALYLYNPIHTPFLEVLLLQYVYSFHMPLFFWIYGYVFNFSTEEKRHQANPILELSKKIQRLIIPLYATAFFVFLPTIFFFGHPDGSLLYMCKKFLLGKDIGHLWFLKSLFYFLIVVIPICDRIKRLSFFQSIAICFAVLGINMSGMIFPSFFRDLLFFLLGYFTRKYVKRFMRENPLFPFSILFVSHLLLFSASKLDLIPSYFSPFLRYITPILGIYFMYFLTVYFSRLTLRKRIWNLISLIDSSSYTIYLFHATFIYIMFYIYSFAPSSNVLFRIIPSILLGISVPLMTHRILSRTRYLSFLFSIPFYSRKEQGFDQNQFMRDENR
jgi:fucose 4-O-acetylase-like acetyltransferase